MKLLLVFAFLAFICVVRTAPTPSSTSRVLILPDYNDDDTDHEDEYHTIADVGNNDDGENNSDDDDDDEHKTTTMRTVMTTSRSNPVFPSRGSGLIPTRRPIQTQRVSSMRTTTKFINDDYGEVVDEYDGDYKYIQDLRRYLQRFIEEFRKVLRKITGSNDNDKTQQDQIDQYED
ncbi:unnamed protein product [Rotaria sp. Silwood2]|nr:unnamed protein product [Rotaria sp. Silwood2]CAF2483510.1 unnamed protein product [Rotaria sp. Silwood2]CAF2715736.1 unnamed protein product [Rotaria sp. Silwood2]CAF2884019.1 unnamed protein product [Rotaria sp. Silwood2]CAF3924723.1 unnamed protein product [Rotaria sp. Silwood2]